MSRHVRAKHREIFKVYRLLKKEQEKTKFTKRKRIYVLNNVPLTVEDLKYTCIIMVCVE